MVAPRTSRPRTKLSNSRGVSAVIIPLAEMSVRQLGPQASAGPSWNSEKRIGMVLLTNRGEQYAAKVGRRTLLRLALPENVAMQELKALDDKDEAEANDDEP